MSGGLAVGRPYREIRDDMYVMRLVLLLTVLGIAGCSWQPWDDLALPSDATMIEHTVLQAGIDRSAAFCIRFGSQAVVDAVVSAYGLHRCDPNSAELTSFVALRPPAWWKVTETDEVYAQDGQKS